MAEALAVGASIVAIIQITDRVIGLCKFYIETAKDAASDLHAILVEISTLKAIFESLKFLKDADGASATLKALAGEDGPIEGCHRSITDLEQLFPSDSRFSIAQNRSKKQKVKATWVALAWPLKESKAKKLLEGIARYKATITLVITTGSLKDINEIKTKAVEMHAMLTQSQRHEVYKWLQDTDPSTLHNRNQYLYEEETGNWMLRSPEWASWLDAKHRCLWIHGIPGAGKTVLMSYLIEQVKRRHGRFANGKCAYAYYHCYYGHSQDESTPFLRWLISQLCRQADLVSNSVYEMYQFGGTPSHPALLHALEEILQNFQITYILFDAIDESIPRDKLLKVLRDLITDPRFAKIQLLASSREYIDIEDVMGQFSVSMSMHNSFVESDIKLYVKRSLQSNRRFTNWPQELLTKVEDSVSSQAKGMFRWAVCQIDVIQWLKCEYDIVERALKNLPKTLYETYDRILLSVLEDDQVFVQHALQWVDFYATMLHRDPKSLHCSLLLRAVGTSTARIDPFLNDRQYDEGTLRRLCGCLITVTPLQLNGGSSKEDSLVLYAHYTVREYLDSSHLSKIATTNGFDFKESLAKHFMATMLFEAARVQSTEAWEMARRDCYDGFEKFCIKASLESFYTHTSTIFEERDLYNLAIDLLNPSKAHYHTLTRHLVRQTPTQAPERFWNVKWDPEHIHTDAVHLYNLIFVPKSSNCSSFVERFLQGKGNKDFLGARLRCFGPNEPMLGLEETYNFDGSIIQFCAGRMYPDSDLLELLLRHGKDLFEPSHILISFVAAYCRTHANDRKWQSHPYGLIDRLLKLGADPNAKGHRITCLQIAVAYRDLEMATILLEAGADPNLTGCSNAVAEWNHTRIGILSHLSDASPLYILDNKRPLSYIKREEQNSYPILEDVRTKIRALLMQYGARLFKKQNTVPRALPKTSPASLTSRAE